MVITFGACGKNNAAARRQEEGRTGTDVGGHPADVLHSLTGFKCHRQLEAEIRNLCNPLKLSFECSSQNSGRQRRAAGGRFS